MQEKQAKTDYILTFKKEKNPWYLPWLLPLFVSLSITYLVIVFGFTVDWSKWFIVLMFIAELYRFFFASISLFCTRTLQYPIFRAGSKPVLVDILIPTYNEPRSVVEKTVMGAINVRGVNKVYLLDDGNRDVMREMAKEYNINYYARKTNLHAKAGNMNFGLNFSDADFIVTLDADHVPLPNFIERTIGYFDDPQLAFVQTPQSFYNLDSIQHRQVENYPTWNEQTMFYESIQPAKNAFNAAFFCGSSAILRRSALNSVGGFATGTATEDIHTSIRLHSKGWKSLFINERLAFGLAPEDLKEYHKQRVRWGAGSLGLLFRTKDSPLIIKNLTIMQRIGYLNSTLAFMQGHFKLFYYILPIYLIFSQISFQSIHFLIYISLYFPFLIGSFWITRVYSRNTYHPLYTEQYNIANIFSNIVALKGIYKVQKKFAVSIKSKIHKENSFVLAGLSLIAMGMLSAEIYAIWIFFTQLHGDIGLLMKSTLVVGLFWNTFNFLVFFSFLHFLFVFNKGSQVIETRYDVKIRPSLN